MNISSISELYKLAQSLIDQWHHKFLLEGNLWVGKTQFVKGIVKALWGNEQGVQSPTYTYMNQYDILGSWIQLLHIDLYRFTDQEDAFAKWMFDAIDNHDYICIERPRWENQYRDHEWTRISFTFSDDMKTRIIEIK